MKTRLLATLTILLGIMCWGALLQAQQTRPDAQQPSSQTQPDAQTPPTQPPPDTQEPPASQAPQQTPDQPVPGQTQRGQAAPNREAQPSDAAGVQIFTGTIMLQGDKYVLQADNGTTYDIDQQDQVKKFAGKKVRVHGTLDPSGKMIHVQ